METLYRLWKVSRFAWSLWFLVQLAGTTSECPDLDLQASVLKISIYQRFHGFQQTRETWVKPRDQEDLLIIPTNAWHRPQVPDSVARGKIASQPPGHAFWLLALSLGGLVEERTSKVFQNERKVAIAPGIFSKLLQRLSLCLVQARARHLELWMPCLHL